MVKYVYPDTNKRTWIIHYREFKLKGVQMSLKSAYPDGRIIADDNVLEGL